jgi:hypothetical protein
MSSKKIDIGSWGKKPPKRVSQDAGDLSADRQPTVSRPSADQAAQGMSAPSTEGVTQASVSTPSAKSAARGQPKGQGRHRETSVSRASDIPARVLDEEGLLEAIVGTEYKLEGKDLFVKWITRNYKRGSRKARTIVLKYLVKVYRKLKKEGFE